MGTEKQTGKSTQGGRALLLEPFAPPCPGLLQAKVRSVRPFPEKGLGSAGLTSRLVLFGRPILMRRALRRFKLAGRWGVLLTSFVAIACSSGGSCASQVAVEQALTPRDDSAKDTVSNPSMPGILGADKNLDEALGKALVKKGPAYQARTHHRNPEGAPLFTNRLILQTSPYLLQHAHNPVNWFAWGKAAFEQAKKLKKPILLSIGYSTCHWCHVMEEESFEDLEIASFMNKHFICIKVDREERPDIDDIYMSAVRALSGRGGWPMTIMMTADKDPFFGGTYIPARDGDRGARTGFLTLLKKMSQEYASDPSRLVALAQATSQKIEAASAPQRPGSVPGARTLNAAARSYMRSLDMREGGFGRAPKFPRPASLDFLMREAHALWLTQPQLRQKLLQGVNLTLSKMSGGGIFDHVGGGFHRYSTDDKWLVPHFEKMLYDNAQLVSAYLDAFLITRDKRYAQTARRTIEYILREMRSPEGAFYSATDADSLLPSGEMEEGYFFTWTLEEVAEVVSPLEARAINHYYDLSIGGNFEQRNIFHTPDSLKNVAKKLNIASEKLSQLLKSGREKLYVARKKRVPPGLDDKILTSWNGLMIGALAQAARVLEEPRYLDAAKKAANYLLSQAKNEKGEVLRSTKLGISRQPGFLDDYSFFISGLLELFEVSADPHYLRAALNLQKRLDLDFWHEGSGGYFKTGKNYEELLARDKPIYDGAEPSGNSVSAENLLRLSNITSEDHYRKRAEELFSAFSLNLTRGTGSPRMLSALLSYLNTPLQLVLIEGENDSTPASPESTFEQIRGALSMVYAPNTLCLFMSEAAAKEGAQTIGLLRGKVALSKKTTAYLCERGHCELPARNWATLRRQLAKKGIQPISQTLSP